MELVDTHTHLYVSEFQDDIEFVLQRAKEEGVSKFYLPAIDASESAALLALEEKYPDLLFAMAGVHPCSVKENFEEEIAHTDNLLKTRRFAAIGETGLDFYWDQSFTKQQYESLQIHMEWAVQYNIPIVLHTRNAMQETIDAIKKFDNKNLRGIFHCFTGTEAQASEIIEIGFLLGIGGVLTYKNSGLDKVVADIDLQHLVLETDAPYLAPVPYRGKRNEPSYLSYVAQKLAEIKNIPVATVAEVTTANAKNIFSS